MQGRQVDAAAVAARLTEKVAQLTRDNAVLEVVIEDLERQLEEARGNVPTPPDKPSMTLGGAPEPVPAGTAPVQP